MEWQCLDIEPFEGGVSCGDWQIFDDISLRFRPTSELQGATPDGLYAIINETYYVEDVRQTSANDEDPPRFVVRCRIEYMVCRDPLDPGGTEVQCEYEYEEVDDLEADVYLSEFYALEAAWRRAWDAIRLDGQDYVWNGRTR